MSDLIPLALAIFGPFILWIFLERARRKDFESGDMDRMRRWM